MTDDQPRLSFLKDGISQVAIIVPDLDKAVESYWTWLGIGPWRIYTYGRPLVRKMAYRGDVTDYRMRIALASVGSLNIELIEMVEGDTIYADFVAEHGFGLHHWGVFVDDIEPALSEAKSAGLTVIQEGAGFGLDGDGHYAYLDTESKISVTIELIELPKRRLPPESIFPAPEGEG